MKHEKRHNIRAMKEKMKATSNPITIQSSIVTTDGIQIVIGQS